jgi:hypothetical protein
LSDARAVPMLEPIGDDKILELAERRVVNATKGSCDGYRRRRGLVLVKVPVSSFARCSRE